MHLNELGSDKFLALTFSSSFPTILYEIKNMSIIGNVHVCMFVMLYYLQIVMLNQLVQRLPWPAIHVYGTVVRNYIIMLCDVGNVDGICT